jgi:cobalt-zinc-cadmium efflux system outer membrane protein
MLKNFLLCFTIILSLVVSGCADSVKEAKRSKYLPLDQKLSALQLSETSPETAIETYEIVEPNGVLTLGQALALTVMNNPELKVFSLESRAAQARELQAGLWPNPEINIEAENVGGTGELSGFEGAETTIQLSQLIELGNKSQKRKKVASLEKELAVTDYQNKKLEIFSEAAKAFILVLKAQEKLQLSNELFKLSEESFETVTKRVDAGKDSPVEKTRASVALTNIKISNRQDQREIEYSRKKLASFWGQDEPLFKEVAGDLYSIEQLPTLTNLTNQLKQNPEYSRWEAEIKKSQAILDLEKSKAMGDITIGAGLRRFNETDDNAFVFGVSIPLPISDRNQGSKQEAVYNLAKSREEQKAVWLKLQNEFNETYQEFANSYSQATSLQNEVLPAAIEMFNAATTAYREGKVDYLNVLDAQRTLFEAKGQYIEALSSYHNARADIERLIGQQIEMEETIQ